MFAEQVARSPDRVALRHKLGGVWRSRTWREWDVRAREVASALCALGIAPGDRVAICAETRMTWVEADLGIMMAGCVTVPIYPSLRADAVLHVLEDSGARLVIAEDPLQVEKLYKGPWPAALGRVVVLDRVRRFTRPDEAGRLAVSLADVIPEGDVDRFVDWSELLEVGRERSLLEPEEIDRRRQGVTAESVATLVYTSGTSGEPKGVVLTHGSIAFEVEALRATVPLGVSDEQLLFLPLAHILARLTIFLQVRTGYATAFAEGMLQAVDNCAEVRPTFVVSVPRVYEKIHETVSHSLESGGDMKRRVWQWAFSVGGRVSALRRRAREPAGLLAIQHRYADKLVFAAIKKRLGGRVRFMVSGAAPLAVSTAELFHAAGVPLLEGYGLTENCGAATLNLPHRHRIGSVGQALPGVDLRIAEDGEVLVRGPNVMRGYHRQPEETARTLDVEGWLHTGDMGRIDSDGFLYITDRKKDLLITSGGKKIAPQKIETSLTRSPYLAHAVVVAEGRRHAVALVTLESDAVRAWARENGISGDLASLSAHPRIRALIGEAVDIVNRELATFETIKSFAILDRDLSVDEGELTPTLKARRLVIEERFADVIESLYE